MAKGNLALTIAWLSSGPGHSSPFVDLAY